MRNIWIVLLFSIFASSLMAESMYSSTENWGFYLDSCNKIDGAVGKVNAQMNEKSDVLFTHAVSFAIERMTSALKEVEATDRNNELIASCDEKASRAKIVLDKAAAYEKDIEKRQKAEIRKRHEESSLYEKALKRGYDDYSWVSTLYLDYREHGEDKIKNWVFLVDNDCGRYFRVIQYLEPYYIYLATKGRFSTCNGRDRIVILPAEGSTVAKGSYISRQSYFEFVGVLDAKGEDGFPVKLPILKQFISSEE